MTDVADRLCVVYSCTTSPRLRRACWTSNASLERLQVGLPWGLQLQADRRQRPPLTTERMLPVTGRLFSWWVPLIYLDSVGVHFAWTRVWRSQYRQWEWTDRKLCCQHASRQLKLGIVGVRTPRDVMTSATGLQYTASSRGPSWALRYANFQLGLLPTELAELPTVCHVTAVSDTPNSVCSRCSMSDDKLYRRLWTGRDRWAL